jgi:hypothetical protein
MPNAKSCERAAEQETFVEPAPVVAIYCDGVATVDIINGNAHFMMFVRQRSPHGGEWENVVNLRVVMPVSAVVPGVELTTNAVAMSAAPRAETQAPQPLIGCLAH